MTAPHDPHDPGADPDVDADFEPGPEDEPAGLLDDEPDPGLPREQDVYSQEGSTSGLSAEEAAVRIKLDEDFEDDQLT
ncbi:DUF5709 domain-containing protein [Streptomyces sp. NPDC002896]|uniref:DUF5709 domain-containing protein n=1 Tax=Streptomyces sp. NPDC002896 TaxID=3154438 RepID=UPI003329F6D2